MLNYILMMPFILISLYILGYVVYGLTLAIRSHLKTKEVIVYSVFILSIILFLFALVRLDL